MAKKYDNSRFDVANVKSRVEFAKSLNEQPAVTITVSALALQHIMTLVQIFSALIAEKPRTTENLEKYATYVAKQKAKGQEADTWETWSRRSNTYAFVNSHAKNTSTGKWEYKGKAGEILLDIERKKSEAALEALQPVFDQLNDTLLDELIADLSSAMNADAAELV